MGSGISIGGSTNVGSCFVDVFNGLQFNNGAYYRKQVEKSHASAMQHAARHGNLSQLKKLIEDRVPFTDDGKDEFLLKSQQSSISLNEGRIKISQFLVEEGWTLIMLSNEEEKSVDNYLLNHKHNMEISVSFFVCIMFRRGNMYVVSLCEDWKLLEQSEWKAKPLHEEGKKNKWSKNKTKRRTNQDHVWTMEELRKSAEAAVADVLGSSTKSKASSSATMHTESLQTSNAAVIDALSSIDGDDDDDDEPSLVAHKPKLTRNIYSKYKHNSSDAGSSSSGKSCGSGKENKMDVSGRSEKSKMSQKSNFSGEKTAREAGSGFQEWGAFIKPRPKSALDGYQQKVEQMYLVSEKESGSTPNLAGIVSDAHQKHRKRNNRRQQRSTFESDMVIASNFVTKKGIEKEAGVAYPKAGGGRGSSGERRGRPLTPSPSRGRPSTGEARRSRSPLTNVTDVSRIGTAKKERKTDTSRNSNSPMRAAV